MTPPRPDSSTAALGACLAAPLAAMLAMASLAAFQADPVATAETAYLALAAGLVVLAAAAVAARPSVEGLVGPVLLMTAVWTLPEGPARGAVAMALAAGTLAVAVWRWLPAWSGPEAAGGAADPEPWLPAVPVVAFAFGVQALLRGAELPAIGPAGSAEGLSLAPALRAAVLFVGFPAIGAAAVLALERLHGRRRALLAAAAVLAAGPGFRPATLAALLALAAAAFLVRRRESRLPAAAAVVVLVAPFAWDARAAAAALVAGLAGALVLAARPPWSWAATALAAAALGAALLSPGRAAGETVALAALVALAVPALALPERARVPLALAALALAFAAARGVLVEGALAAPAGLAALAVPRRGPVVAVQGAWSAALLAAAGLLTAYPWLRPTPLPEALRLFGLEPGWPGALLAVAGAGALAGLAGFWGRAALAGLWGRSARTGPSEGGEAVASRAAAALLLALVFLHLPLDPRGPGAMPLDGLAGAGGPLVLGEERPAWAAALGPRAERGGVRTIVLDSALANAAAVPHGTPVATLRLRDPDRADRLWTLRMGEETGEWAADRPDLRSRRPPAPEPWLSWVAEGGGFFGHRYRALRRLAEPVAAQRVELSLRPDLPPGVELSVFHLELRP